MSILDSIKGERKLSLNHWRYRLLHWTFNVKDANPKNIYCNGIPKFLYTHYCPLFHLTNLIALLSPFIFGIKFTALVFSAIVATFDLVPWGKIKTFFSKFFPKKKCSDECCNPEIDAAMERRFCIKYICEWHTDIDSFLACYCFNHLTKEDVTALYNEYMPRVLQAREEAKLRKEKWRQTIIFWTNFSQVFIKWALNVLYFGLTALLLWGVYEAAFPVWDFMCWLPSFVYWLLSDLGTLSALWIACKLLFWATIIVGFISFVFTSGAGEKFLVALVQGYKYISPPFVIFLLPFKWIKSGWDNTLEFVSMFYEENCPPVTIISEEEAAVESVARNGEEV